MKKYYGNLGTGRLHITKYASKRCEVKKQENKIEFDSYEEAKSYPIKEEPKFKDNCAICFPRMRKAEQKKNK